MKAAEIDQMLRRATGPLALTTLGDVRDQYLATPVGRGRKGGDWAPTHLMQRRNHLRRALRGSEHLRAMDVDPAVLDHCRAQAGTINTVAENTAALRGLLQWGRLEGFFSAAQVALLPAGAPPVRPAVKGTRAPSRRRKERRQGESDSYIRDEDAPSRSQVIALREQLSRLAPSWGELAPELACGTGLYAGASCSS